MDFNNLIFPAPKYDPAYTYNYKEEIIFIPKPIKNPNEPSQYIPAIFLKTHPKIPVKNYIIFFHGNAEDIFGARNMAERVLNKLNMNIIIVEYPGYSIYDSPKDSNTILEDTLIVYDHLLSSIENITEENIFVFGRSIGTSPAIYLASNRKPSGLFLVSAFTSIGAVAKNLVGFLKIFLNDRFKSIEYIKNVTCPIIFIHGQKDPLIPYKETQMLKEACDCPTEVLFPEQMTHNEYDLDEDIIDPIYKFVQKHCCFDETDKGNLPIIKDEFYFIPEDIEKKIYGMKQ